MGAGNLLKNLFGSISIQNMLKIYLFQHFKKVYLIIRSLILFQQDGLDLFIMFL